MKLPAFIAEAISPANRWKLRFGIYTGYAVAGVFALLAGAASIFQLTPWRWAFVGLISTKLLTNSVAWLALTRERGVALTQILNSTADVVLLTGAIYFTGGPYSPLLATYVIIVAVLSLLANLGVTILVAACIVLSFATMLLLMMLGVLPPTVVPGAPGEAPT